MSSIVEGLPINAQEREHGQDVRSLNVTAAVSIANIVKSSLGPQGLDKMLVDDIGEVTVTNDGATILKQLEVEHPAAKVLVELAQTQDEAVGDGTTSVVLVAAELLKRGNDLIKDKIHPTSVISGFKLAAKKAIEFVKNARIKTDSLGKEALINVAKTSMSSKILGSESDLFGPMIVNALTQVKTVSTSGKEKYNIKSVHIVKQHGKSARESILVNGFALARPRASQQMPQQIKKAKIALLDIALNKQKMKMGVQVVINDPSQLLGVQQKEQTMIRDRIQMVLKAGANVILTSKGIDDMCVKYFVEAGAIAVRRVEKEDLKRIAKLTGATLVTSFANLEGDEAYDPSNLGEADEVAEERVGDSEVLYIRGGKTTMCQSIVLRGANDFMLDEMERTVHDALCAVKRVLESNYVVPGGGAIEAALSIYLENLATTIESREQLAIAEFAQALLVIPKTLAVNAALDSTELVANLRVFHSKSQKPDADANAKLLGRFGLDLIDGNVVDNVDKGVLEPALTKVKILQFATEASTTILRIDDMIKIQPAKQSQEDH